ncbi:MAG: gliding motility protein GldM [Prevotellaceae bacterium]|nr:gliding motility protein GldM [Prevotellaceae bacterium]
MAIKKRPVSPRQKMINLMYVVLMAMLALNISTEVLDGFTIVEEGLTRTTKSSTLRNEAIYNEFSLEAKKDPKVRHNFKFATELKGRSDSLYNYVDKLKWDILREADGDDADMNNIVNKDNLESASHIMLAPTSGQGQKLYDAVNGYKDRILSMISKEDVRKIVRENLSTDIPKSMKKLGKNWQECLFESMPVAAAITLLTKLQSDIRYVEGETLHCLAEEVGIVIPDAAPTVAMVNNFTAFVIPNAQTVTRGSKFSAKIVMAAIDSTQQPKIFVGGTQLRNNTYERVCTSSGDFTLSGFIEMLSEDGQPIRRNFTQKYTVVDPTATVSADLMNVLYAGYDNPMSVSVPGVPLNNVSMTMSGGSLSAKGQGKYVARPAKPGSQVTFTVTANMNGTSQQMGQFTFQVRKLPDPTAYIDLPSGDGTDRFKGGSLSKAQLMGVNGIGAAIDDGLLNIPFKVLSFEAVFFDQMGNAIPQRSEGASFSEKQKSLFRSLSRGKRFYISRVVAIGPDGIQRTLPQAMEIIVK